jgi:hypothetical protein
MNVKAAGRCAVSWLLVFLLASPSCICAQGSSSSSRFTQEELDQMLAPIALYPDSLLAQILMAATYPVEVVEAHRWLKKNKGLRGDELNAALDSQNWDLSVKALVPFPHVLAVMSDKLDWTQKVGDAFLDQQGAVMDTIQKLRSKAHAQGNLKTTREQKVVVEPQAILIEPASPQVVYVPAYDPTIVYGSWWYPGYPPYYWHPAGTVTAAGLLSFAAGVAVGAYWNSGWGSWNWGGHQINANINRNININRNDIHINNIQTSKWQHDAAHRKGDPYRSQESRDRYGRTGKGDGPGKRDFRGFDPDDGDKSGRGSGRKGAGERNDDGDFDRRASGQREKADKPDRQTRDQDKDLDRSDRKELKEGKGSNAFHGIDHGNDAQKFSDRGRASRHNGERGEGERHHGGGGGGRGRK